MSAYARPTRLDDALALRALGGCNVLAGGTDPYPGRVDAGLVRRLLEALA